MVSVVVVLYWVVRRASIVSRILLLLSHRDVVRSALRRAESSERICLFPNRLCRPASLIDVRCGFAVMQSWLAYIVPRGRRHAGLVARYNREYGSGLGGVVS